MKTFTCPDCSRLLTCACVLGPDRYSYSWMHGHFGDGAIRCASCSAEKRRVRQEAEAKAERERMERHIASNHEDGEVCSDCCPHSEYDHGICMDCGTDCTDDLAGAAEAYYEGDR